MTESPSNPGRTGRWLVIGAGIVLLIVAAVGYRPLLIRYHLSQYEHWKPIHDKQLARHRQMWRGGLMVVPASADYFQKFGHHRTRLVELGHVVVKSHRLRHIKPMTPEAAHFVERMHEIPSLDSIATLSLPVVGLDSMIGRLPEWHSVDPVGYHHPDEGDFIVYAWIEPSSQGEWDAFIREYDVPDYRKRHMSGAASGRNQEE